jgi:hypothetical protein
VRYSFYSKRADISFFIQSSNARQAGNLTVKPSRVLALIGKIATYFVICGKAGKTAPCFKNIYGNRGRPACVTPPPDISRESGEGHECIREVREIAFQQCDTTDWFSATKPRVKNHFSGNIFHSKRKQISSFFQKNRQNHISLVNTIYCG